MEAYDFYAYWNGREVAELWTVIAAITSTDDYRTLIAAVMTGGFLAVMIGAAVRNRGMDAVTWFAATILVFSMAYYPRVTIAVKDVRAGYTQAVEGVPLGIGWPASVTSRVSWWLTQTFETAFQDVDAASFSRFGVAFPQRAVSALMAMGPVTEKGRESLRAVTERCIVPEMLDSPDKRRALLEAPDIYLLVSEKDWVNPARRVVLDGSVVTCADALPILTQYLSETEIPAMENMLLTKLEAGGDEIASAAFLAALPGAEELMLGTSRTLTESLRQSLMMSVIPDATLSAAAKAGKAPLSTGVALARAQGNLASEINYRTLADMAKSALPKVRNVLEFIVIGLFPIVLLMMAGLGLGGLTVFRAYLTLLISVALWAPITAIINFLTIHVDAEPMNRLVEAAGGVTLSAATLIREAGASSQAMAGSLMWLVPVLAYAVAKGSDMAITSMASSVLAPAASAAQSQGSAIAMGNVSAGNASVGNTSVNNTTGNKSDMSSSYASPNMHRSTMAEGSWQGNLATGTVTAMSVAETNLGITSQGGLSYGVSMAAVQGSSSGASYVSASGYGETTGTSSTSITQGTVTRGTGYTSSSGSASESSRGNISTYSSYEVIASSVGMQSNGASGESFAVNSALMNSGVKSHIDGLTGHDENKLVEGMQTTGIIPSSLPNASLSSAVPNTMSRPNNSKSVPSESSLTNGRIASNLSGTTNVQKSDHTSFGATVTDSKSLSTGNSVSDIYRHSDAESLSDKHEASISHGQGSTFGETRNLTSSESHSNLQTSTNNRHFTNDHQSHISTGVAMNTTVRDEALNVFGSPQEALMTLNRSTDSRLAFGRHMQNVVRNRENLTDSIGNSIFAHNTHHFDYIKKKSDLKASADADAAGIESANAHSQASVRKERPQPMFGTNSFMPISEPDRQQFLLVKGLTIAASAQYQQTETGLLSVGSRSFLFGLGYSSPAELYKTLQTKSEADPEFRAALIELGKKGQESSVRPLDSAEVVRILSR